MAQEKSTAPRLPAIAMIRTVLALICEADESVPAGSEGVDTCPVPVVVAGKPLKPPVDDMVAIAVPVESELPNRKHPWRPNAAM